MIFKERKANEKKTIETEKKTENERREISEKEGK